MLEFATPIRNICFTIDSIIDNEDENSVFSQTLLPIKHASKVLACSINDVVDRSLITDKEFKPNMTLFNLKETIQAMANAVESQYPEQGN
jgi:hypothetical protein